MSMSDERIYQVLLGPHVSEKATNLSDKHRQFAFRVAPNARKPEIRQAVEKLFKVVVEDVRVLNVRGKQRRTRYGVGRRASWKKAYVRLAPGHDIDFSVTE